ncbi:hypothetical protein SISNIDRAFT_488604 [Sistotremastrum niveocremeum HHB9708]|uniref:Uncharacterized protein n=1 Tax=Sistotremastrum niveocremeum HHB9708 TaxID=1314777 RepID=A0A164QXY5_9AGAM|nr:hypothetical protein SISNIDRAFT_488604 [Sistotremastrum niveocremeum HHB9708]
MPPVEEIKIRIIPSEPSEAEASSVHDVVNPRTPISPALSSTTSSPNLTSSSLPVTTGVPGNPPAETSVRLSQDVWDRWARESVSSPVKCEQCPPPKDPHGSGGPNVS